MSTNHAQGTAPAGPEVATGGLLWSRDGGTQLLAVVRRGPQGDWTLPKGHPQAGEGLDAAARRAAMEETGSQASVNNLAGSYSYTAEGKPQVVLMWHMTRMAEPYGHPAANAEAEHVVWLPPEAAIRRLSHGAERDFVARHRDERRHGPVKKGREWWTKLPEYRRLEAAIHSVRQRFLANIGRPTAAPATWWATSAQASLEEADAGLERRDLDGGWGALHDAQRFMVFGMDPDELTAFAISLQAETQAKLGGWRAQAAGALFAPLPLADWLKACGPSEDADRLRLQYAVIEALVLLNGHSDNLYHRMHLVGRQLKFLVFICGGLVIVALLGAICLVPTDSQVSWRCLAAVAMAGALGAVVSAMFQLSRVGEADIPEALLYGLVTSGRPLVGAVSAMFVYLVMRSNVISLIEASKVDLKAGLVLGFVAGFSESLVLKTVAKIAGTEKNEPGTGGKSNPGGSLLGARDEGLASVTATDGEPGVAKDKTKTKGETKAGAGAGGPGAPKANADKPAKERPPA